MKSDTLYNLRFGKPWYKRTQQDFYAILEYMGFYEGFLSDHEKEDTCAVYTMNVYDEQMISIDIKKNGKITVSISEMGIPYSPTKDIHSDWQINFVNYLISFFHSLNNHLDLSRIPQLFTIYRQLKIEEINLSY